MTSHAKPKVRPAQGRFFGFHHLEFFVSNAKQVSDWYCHRFGFQKVGYKGLETGSRDFASHVIQQGKVVFVFTSALNPQASSSAFSEWLAQRGDAVKDVGFKCDNPARIYEFAVQKGAKSVMKPTTLKDEHGTVIVAKIETYGGVIHSLINDDNYSGVFMPGYKKVEDVDPMYEKLNHVGLGFIDHCVGNQPDNEMENVCNWYQNTLNFHRFWSVDDSQVHTQYSSLRSIVMTDFDETIKMPLNEPADGMRKSQIQEYVEYHGGAGVQHIALNTPDILTAVSALRSRGMKFLTIPAAYYDNLRKRLANSPITVEEDLKKIQEQNILVDFDDQGYLLQIFTEPVEDRPTLFLEIIQRAGNQGFGIGNFKALFTSIEMAQEKRGNLTETKKRKIDKGEKSNKRQKCN